MTFSSKRQILYICFYFFTSVLSSTAPLFHGRIIGGEIAQPGQFPYIVSVDETVEEVGYSGHTCGGTIVNKQWVVTAAHCIIAPTLDDYEITAGTNLLDTDGIKYNISKIFVHQQFNFTVLWHDIAMIQIVGEFDFANPLIQPIEMGDVSGNETVTAIGWGSTEVEEFPNKLHFLELTALSYDDCERLAEGAEFNDELPRGPGHVCAFASKGKATCHGDSGSTLMHNNTFVGVVSYGLESICANGFPDVYTRVSYYRDWIENIMSAHS